MKAFGYNKKYYSATSVLLVLLLGIFLCADLYASQSRVPCAWTGCTQNFASVTNMRIHVEAVHKGVKRHSCSMCGRAFAKKQNMQAHKKTHLTNNKLFRCVQCGKNFLRKNNRQRHMKSCKLRCDWCKVPFLNRNKKIEHEKSCGKKPNSESDDEHVLEPDGATFFLIGQLSEVEEPLEDNVDEEEEILTLETILSLGEQGDSVLGVSQTQLALLSQSPLWNVEETLHVLELPAPEK